jgi:hypothetical protein
MHVLIPFASASSDGCTTAWNKLALPNFKKLISALTLMHTNSADEYTLSPPHERALAQMYGISAADGQIPWAAWQRGAHAGSDAWAFITPCFWHVGVDHINMGTVDDLQLSEEDSRTLLAAMQPYFVEDGITLHYDTPTRWLASSALFKNLATASLDRVQGRNVNAWMPEAAQAKPLRRLQNEMQMLLYQHPVNDARAARGQVPINSFWVSGTGALDAQVNPAHRVEVRYDNRLTTAALHEDWANWATAWQQLDATLFAQLLQNTARKESVSLTLCGERAAQTWEFKKQSLAYKIMHTLGLKANKNQREQL